jgi:hypothetical protein
MPLAKILVVHQEHPNLGKIVLAGAQVRLGDAVIREHALDVEIADREIGGAADRGSGIAARRPIGDAVDLKIPDVVGEAEDDGVAARDLPAGGERGHLAGEMRGEG